MVLGTFQGVGVQTKVFINSFTRNVQFITFLKWTPNQFKKQSQI